MKRFDLCMKEHEEYGEMGISMSLNGRDYFDPALSGDVIAHDILEHPTKPHSNGYIDELMALGGFLAGRVESGWRNKYGRYFGVRDLSRDISSLAEHALMEGEGDFCPESCNSRLKDVGLVKNITESVKEGLLNAVNEHEDEDYKSIPNHYNFDVNSIVGWICKGYQLFRRRFPDTYTASVYLFDRIAGACSKWSNGAEEGDMATLYVDFSGARAWVETEGY